MSASRTANSQSGFTLVEVLVSLAIFSLAIVGLNRAATLAVRGTTDLELRSYAGFVADNMVARSRINAPAVGTDRREADFRGLSFDVAIETAPTELERFVEIRVRVSQTDQDRVLAERRAFHYSPRAVVAETPADGSEGEP